MISAAVEHQPWPHRRWALVVLLLMVLQFGFIAWLSRVKTPTPPPIASGPQVAYATGSGGQWPGMSDPTLFVLANPRGFSGAAWLQIPPQTNDLPKWSDEQVRPFSLPAGQLGSEAGEFLRTNMPAAFELAPKSEPVFDALPLANPLGDAHSALTIEGDLASRPLLSQLKLDSWPDTEILTNSEVSVAVDAHGNVFSAVLAASCGAKTDTNAQNADARALLLATSARFQALPTAGPVYSSAAPPRLQWGKLVFHWHTMPSTNIALSIP
jgi:hypothetical protein